MWLDSCSRKTTSSSLLCYSIWRRSCCISYCVCTFVLLRDIIIPVWVSRSCSNCIFISCSIMLSIWIGCWSGASFDRFWGGGSIICSSWDGYRCISSSSSYTWATSSSWCTCCTIAIAIAVSCFISISVSTFSSWCTHQISSDKCCSNINNSCTKHYCCD